MEEKWKKSMGVAIERRRSADGLVMPGHHFHDFYEIYYLMEGNRQYFIETTSYRIPSQTLVLIPPGYIHKTAPLDDTLHERLLFEIDTPTFFRLQSCLPSEFKEHMGKKPILVVPFTDQYAIAAEDTVKRIADTIDVKEPGYWELMLLQLQELLLLALRQSLHGASLPIMMGKKQSRVYDIVQYITANMGNVKNLDELCSRFFFSKSRLCLEFKSVTGLTVQQYIGATRIRCAQIILQTETIPVTEVAFRLGYGSITHFERMFKRATGLSPLQYRKHQRANLQYRTSDDNLKASPFSCT